MSHLRGFQQKLAAISRLWDEHDYDSAFTEVEAALKTWPGNAHLHVLWASLVQLQENPSYDLDDAKQALQKAVELDRASPAAAIELGHFLDHVEDNPQAASKVYAEGVAYARQLLIDGLIGQAKAFQQLEKHEEFRRCLLEVLHLTQFDSNPKSAKTAKSATNDIVKSPSNHFYDIQLKGPYAEQIHELLSEVVANHSA